MKENIKKAVDLAEQEVQEKEIAKLKGIIKDLLQKKVDKEDEKREIEKEISVIKQTIDDFKAGRLDKIKELIENDSRAKEILPFKVYIVNQPIITKPWDWKYRIETPQWTVNSGNNLVSLSCSGTVATNFSSGTYQLLNNKVINI